MGIRKTSNNFFTAIRNPPTDPATARANGMRTFDTDDAAQHAFARAQPLRQGKGGEIPFDHEAEAIRPKEKGDLALLARTVNDAIFPHKERRAKKTKENSRTHGEVSTHEKKTKKRKH